ncbi:MAG: redoxin domain-containing protein, partial [Planctomycetota bacterium]
MHRFLIALLTLPLALQTQGAPEFPPGVWSDGGDYSIADFEGKVLVLVFYDDGCSVCAQSTGTYSALQQQFVDEPVYVFAVAVNDSEELAARYVRDTKMDVPVFVDNAGLLTAAYGFDIPHDGNRKIVVVRPDGSIRNAGFKPEYAAEAVERLADDVALTYDPADVPAIFLPILRDVEIGQWDRALRTARPGLTSPDDTVRSTTERLYEVAGEEADKLLEQGKAAVEAGNAVEAMLAFEQVVNEFALLDEKANQARRAAAPLRKDPEVQRELRARDRHAQLTNGLR